MGASASQNGLSSTTEPCSTVSALTGFDPSRVAELEIRCETFEDCLRTVCHHLELPQSESGPCDDVTLYDRSLEDLDLLYRKAEAERAVAVSRLHRAEAALQPFADAAAPLSDLWSDGRRAATIRWEGLKVEHFRRAKQVLAIAMEAREGTDPKGLDGEAATARAGAEGEGIAQ
jgi:hypothetical protein